MPKQPHHIYAGSRSVDEIIESDDTLTTTIRHTDEHSRHMSVICTALPSLIDVLQGIQQSRQTSG